MVGKSKTATLAEKQRMNRLSMIRCVACWETGLCCGKTEVHHQNADGKNGGKRLGHLNTIPLGRWHHQGIPLPGYTVNQMRLHFGPSMKLHHKAFTAQYGSDAQLLEKVNQFLESHREIA